MKREKLSELLHDTLGEDTASVQVHDTALTEAIEKALAAQGPNAAQLRAIERAVDPRLKPPTLWKLAEELDAAEEAVSEFADAYDEDPY